MGLYREADKYGSRIVEQDHPAIIFRKDVYAKTPSLTDVDLNFADRRVYNYSFAKFMKGEEPNEMTITRIESGPSATIEQLVMAEAYMQVVAERIKTNGHEVPSVLANELASCSGSLRDKLRGDRMRQVAALKLRRDQLLPNDQKLRNIEAEIAELESKLK